MSDPIAEFGRLFERASETEPDATACALATADREGGPSVRMVLLKSFGDDGFTFFTNYESRKAGQLESWPRAALCFYWESQGRQVRVEGNVARVSAEESDDYFATRPRGSQLGAWASAQSRTLPSRWRLLRAYVGTKLRYAGRDVPRPEHWGGYRLTPDRIELWSSERYRLHDRRLYLRDGDGWVLRRLYP